MAMAHTAGARERGDQDRGRRREMTEYSLLLNHDGVQPNDDNAYSDAGAWG